jgi:5'-nucleotidase
MYIFSSQVNGKYIIKSGTDFRHFSKITLNFDKVSVDVNVEEITVTSAFPEDPTLKQLLDKYTSKTENCDQ